MLSVIAKIDKSSRARLSWIQSFAVSFGIVPKPIYGHITLAALDGDRDAAIAACKDALEGQAAFTVDFEKIDVLRDEKVVVALAARGGALDEVRSKLVPGGDDWTPCTQLLRDHMVNLNWVCTAMTEMFQPFTAKVDRIEFMSGNEIVDGIDLKGEEA